MVIMMIMMIYWVSHYFYDLRPLICERKHKIFHVNSDGSCMRSEWLFP